MTTMATESLPAAQVKQSCSLFDVTPDLFDSCHLFNPASDLSVAPESSDSPFANSEKREDFEKKVASNVSGSSRLTCNTCRIEFESLQAQRSHFKSDIHRLNIKLSIAGKTTVKEEDFDELTSESFQDYDVSSISGSEDEADSTSFSRSDVQKSSGAFNKKKLYIRLHTGEKISIWKNLIMDECENLSYESDKAVFTDDGGAVQERDVIKRLKSVTHETRDNKNLRIVLLASGGHFAGTVFDGKKVVAQKTFHRYVVRARAGKSQSAKDGSGKSIHSAGASLRRYNELALKKEIQELLASWKLYFDASSCVFIHSPSNSRQLLFDGGKPHFSNKNLSVRNIPFIIRRPTFKESQRVYNQLTQIYYEVEGVVPTEGRSRKGNSNFQEHWGKHVKSKESSDSVYNQLTQIGDEVEEVVTQPEGPSRSGNSSVQEDRGKNVRCKDSSDNPMECEDSIAVSDECDENESGTTTPLHEAAKSGDPRKVEELLDQGMDPCVKDERGKTPYMVASDKEVRNTFRRFMASNLDKWDWHAAKVPSALTKEMEESQAAKQAEKDAKRKAKAKELKKLRKAREKQSQAGAAQSQVVAKTQQSPSNGACLKLSKEEELKRKMAAEREKRAAAAERRMAGLNLEGNGTTATSSSAELGSGSGSDITCSCCNASLVGRVPFHRYNYKYCSTSCMYVHKEMLEDG